MKRLDGSTAMITGASSGIGEATAGCFAAEGARIILAARRVKRLEELQDRLRATYGSESLVVPLDTRNRKTVERAVAGLPAGWADIDILVNSAGLALGLDTFPESDADDIETMIDTNVKGLIWVTRAVVPGMIARGRGTIVNLGSVAGREPYPKGHVYCATKHAVRALTQAIRMDLVDTPVRLTEIQPGMVETEFSLVRFHGDGERAKRTYRSFPPLTASDVAEAILFAVTRPPHVSIHELQIMPQAQASVQVTRRTPGGPDRA